MFENRFTESAQNAINLAAESAMELGHNYVGTEHMLLGLIKEGDGVAAKILESNDINEENVTEAIREMLGNRQSLLRKCRTALLQEQNMLFSAVQWKPEDWDIIMSEQNIFS